MRHAPILVILTLLAVTLIGCHDSSSAVISEGEMEEILYDYHLADAMAQQAEGGYEKNAIAYRAAVLKKYGVSQERFDTSMVYYMRHTDRLHDMYENIAERMQAEARSIGADASGGSVSAKGDSANVWKGEPSLVLVPNQPYNLYSYDLKTDTTFHKGDHILLSFRSDFIFQDGMRDGVAVLAVVFNNDSVVSRSVHMSSSMPMTMQIDDEDSLGIKQIKGLFMLSKNNDMNASSTTLQLMTVSNIQLIRVHSKDKPRNTPNAPLPATMTVDKALPDSERMKPPVSR